jgi:outer membrane protein
MKKHPPLVALLCAGIVLGAAPLARHAAAASPPEAPAGDAPDPAASVRVLTLAVALQAARAHQPSHLQALGNLINARGQADQARGALLPQLNGSASYTRATNNFVFTPGGMVQVQQGMQATTPPPPTFATRPLWRFAVTASQLVYDFGESINRWRAAAVAADAQAESVRTTDAQITYNVRFNFFTARAAKDLALVARETLANQQRHLDQVTTLVKVGNRPEIDLSQARADRANAQLGVINAENAYAVAKATLNQVMGIERSIDYDLSDEELPPVDVEGQAIDPLVDEARRMRPEMANLRLNYKSQELSLRSAKDMVWPALTLNGSANESGPYLDNMDWNFSGMASLTVPILQGGTIRAQIKQAQGQLLAAQAQLDTQRYQVRLDVEQAVLGVRAAKAAIEAADDVLANSRDRLRLAEGRYTSGIGNMIELGDAQVALTTAAAQVVQARYQLSTARAQLLKALGRP